MKLEQAALRELERLRSDHLLRHPRVVLGAQGPELILDGRRVLCLCSNNYLGLANHPAIAEAVAAALQETSVGTCGSRHITGSMSLHKQLESRIATFCGQPQALLFATGYAANLGTIQALATSDTLILSDALNHASIIDGCRLSSGTTRVYRHVDLGHARTLLLEHRARHETALLVTESLFSMDGDVAPLRELRALCDEFDVGMLVDEAHGLGVCGPAGKGLCASLGVSPDLLIGMFGKAFGVSGAFVAGSVPVIQLIENRARSYVFSTAPSPLMAAAALTAIDLVERADDARHRLQLLSRRIRETLQGLGYALVPGDSQVLPVILGAPDAAAEFSAALLERGVFVHGVRPPTVPAGTSRLRLAAMATHTDPQIDFALEQFRDLAR